MISAVSQRPAGFWLMAGIAFLLLVWVLRAVLLPFILGMGIAYFLNPVCQALIRRGLSRTLATLFVLSAFFLLVTAVLLLIAPLVVNQVGLLVQNTPGYVDAARAFIEPHVQSVLSVVSAEQVAQAKEALGKYAGTVGTAAVSVLGGVWRGGLALVDLVSLLIVTPIAAFYMLRDWPSFMNRLNDWLPRPYAKTIRTLLREMDRTLAGFVRGQATVCFLLAAYYVIALMLVGLNFGVVIGLLSGLLSFIPFVGSTLGLLLAMAIAFGQFDSYTPIVIVAGIFMLAQFIEGNFITPKFVGESVGLHPVWVMFALMAGGSLFGFTGLLLAVPVTAVIGVLVRFGLSEYLASSFYKGAPKAGKKA